MKQPENFTMPLISFHGKHTMKTAGTMVGIGYLPCYRPAVTLSKFDRNFPYGTRNEENP